MSLAAFDLEIAKLVDDDLDWKTQRPLGISCAAVTFEKPGYFQTRSWWHEGPKMSRLQCQDLVRYLQHYVKEGRTLVTWNGLAFDFDILAEESGMYRECAQLALNHVDMMFLVVARKGYFLGLETACKGMGVEGKLDSVKLKDGTYLQGMHGSRAPELWAQGEYYAVLDYLEGDVRATLQLAQAIRWHKFLRWTSKSGRNMQFETDLFTVKEASRWPLPNTAWMDNPPSRKSMLSWAINALMEER